MDYEKIEDSVLKSAMDFFQQNVVDFFGINAKIVAPAQTELKDIKKVENYIDAGSIKYNIEAYYMNNIDGDEKYDYLKNKIDNNQELTNEEVLSLTFIPLMKGKLTRAERTIRSIELVDKINISDSKLKCLTMSHCFIRKIRRL